MVVADDSPHLIYSETEGVGGLSHRIALVGARSRAIVLDRSHRRITIAVRLRPGALPSLFGIAAHEVTDRSVPLELLPRAPAKIARAGPPASELLERTASAHGVETLFAWMGWRLGVDEALGTTRGAPTARAGRRAPNPAGTASPDWRIRALPDPRSQGSSASVPLGVLCRELGVSPRTLRQAFQDGVGLPPSTVLRIRRLQAALLEGLHGPEGWSRVAYRFGYADHSHLIRDCRDLLGETPETFRRRFAPERPPGASMPIRTIAHGAEPSESGGTT